MRKRILSLAAVPALALMLGTAAISENTVTMETMVEDFQITAWFVECPGSGGDRGFSVDLTQLPITDDMVEPLLNAVNAFEYENGVQITSHSRSQDFVLVLDEITTLTQGPLDGPGKELCDLLRQLTSG